MTQLTPEELKAIRDRAIPIRQYDTGQEGYEDGYISGATEATIAEREKVAGLVTLEIYLTNGRVAKMLYPADITTVDCIINTVTHNRPFSP